MTHYFVFHSSGEKQREKEKDKERHGSTGSTNSNKSLMNGNGNPKNDIKPEKTWVHDIFEGTLTNETRCLCCETVSKLTHTNPLCFFSTVTNGLDTAISN